jgi:hypothetical protein
MQTGFGIGIADGNNAYLNREYISGPGALSLSSSIIHMTQSILYHEELFRGQPQSSWRDPNSSILVLRTVTTSSHHC